MHKNIVSDNLKEFVLGIEAAVKEGYSVVEESVAFESGYFKTLTQKKEGVVEVEEDISSRMTITVLDAATAVEMLDNPGESNEKLKEILELDKPAAFVTSGTKTSKRNRK